jgi:predicted transcriptional regulator
MNLPTGDEAEVDNSAVESLLEFFKALADPNRLKIAGLLAGQPLTVEQLAEMLNLRSSTVSHHLSYLSHAGLVSARADSYYNVYSLETANLENMARQLLKRETFPALAADIDLEAYDRKVIRDFSLPDGRLKALPAQYKKLEAVLRYVVRAFEPGLHYTEKQVNEILRRFHEDTAQLRRELVESGLLKRQGGGGEYWKPISPEVITPSTAEDKSKKDKPKKNKHK